MSLDDIIKRNQRSKGGPGGLIGAVIRSEITDPMADAEDRKRRLLAFAIVGGLILGIVVLVALFS